MNTLERYIPFISSGLESAPHSIEIGTVSSAQGKRNEEIG